MLLMIGRLWVVTDHNSNNLSSVRYFGHVYLNPITRTLLVCWKYFSSIVKNIDILHNASQILVEIGEFNFPVLWILGNGSSWTGGL